MLSIDKNRLDIKKNSKMISEDISSIINLLSYDIHNKAKLAGSSELRSQINYSDYDLFNIVNVKENQSIEQNKKEIYVKILSKVEEIEKSNDTMWMTDLKAGINDSLYINLRKEKPETIIDFYRIKESNKEISKDEFKNLFNLYEKYEQNDIISIFNFLDACRKLYTLRWSFEELKKGFKSLNGKRKTFEDAIDDSILTKLDVMTWNEPLFNEFSNIYQFKRNKKSLNFSFDDIQLSLRKDITLFYKLNKYFKCLKRLFILSELDTNQELQLKLTTLFNSDVGLCYKLNGHLNNIYELLEKGHKPSFEKINISIQDLKMKLSNVWSFEYSDKVFETLDDISKLKNYESIKKGLKPIIDIFNKLVNEQAKIFIKNNNLESIITNYFITNEQFKQLF